MEFSAQSGTEFRHQTHSNHPLRQATLNELYLCSGCKEYGAGTRYVCQECDFQLHEFCMFSPQLLKDHPLHTQHQLLFQSKPRSGLSHTKCDICGTSAKGFVFRCRTCTFQMHPCCALLSTDTNLTAHIHPLKLQPLMQNSVTSCGQCGKKRVGGRIYHCTTCDYQIHAVCSKAFLNGLQVNGIPTPEKPSGFATAARVASQVIVEFIGGLVEGIGEGVGDAIVDNMVGGRGIINRRGTH